jgi:hypothetical protein
VGIFFFFFWWPIFFFFLSFHVELSDSLLFDALSPGKIQASSMDVLRALRQWAHNKYAGSADPEAHIDQFLPPNTLFTSNLRNQILSGKNVKMSRWFDPVQI